eukprot:318739-Pyramimonas_sp.AAC.1
MQEDLEACFVAGECRSPIARAQHRKWHRRAKVFPAGGSRCESKAAAPQPDAGRGAGRATPEEERGAPAAARVPARMIDVACAESGSGEPHAVMPTQQGH